MITIDTLRPADNGAPAEHHDEVEAEVDHLGYGTWRDQLEHRVSTAFMYALLALVILNVADVVMTRSILSIGAHHGLAAYEADPVSRALLGGYRVEIVKIVILALAEGVRRYLKVTMVMLAAGWFVAGMYGMAALSNTMVLWRLVSH